MLIRNLDLGAVGLELAQQLIRAQEVDVVARANLERSGVES